MHTVPFLHVLIMSVYLLNYLWMKRCLLSLHRLCYRQTSAASAAAPIAGVNHPFSLDAGLRGSSVPEEEANAKHIF